LPTESVTVSVPVTVAAVVGVKLKSRLQAELLASVVKLAQELLAIAKTLLSMEKPLNVTALLPVFVTVTWQTPVVLPVTVVGQFFEVFFTCTV
jgi:hypothetical protein